MGAIERLDDVLKEHLETLELDILLDSFVDVQEEGSCRLADIFGRIVDQVRELVNPIELFDEVSLQYFVFENHF